MVIIHCHIVWICRGVMSTSVASNLVSSSFGQALWRGLSGRCPACGRGALFGRYLKVNAACSGCGLQLSEFRADDAPPYFTILIVGHLIVPAMLVLEQTYQPAEWIHAALWLPLTVILSL